jgi:hypothetical protein
MAKPMNPQPKPQGKVIFRPWRVDPRTGKKIYASTYGLKAWPISVDDA